MGNQLDDLLVHLGTGRWTVLHCVAMAYSSLFLAPHTFGGAFLAPRLDFACLPSYNSSLPNSAFSNSAPTNSALTNSALSTLPSPSQASLQGVCHYVVETPKGEVAKECVEFAFDNSTFSSTVTSEFNLACDRAYLQTSFQSLYMLGIFFGAPVTGYLSDKYGRKRTVVMSTVVYLALGLVSAWLPLLSLILASRFIMGFFHSAVSYISYVLMVEVLEPKMRIVAAFGAYNVWVLGTMLYGGLGYGIRDWRILQTVMTLPGLLLLPMLWWVDESPRWLIVNGRWREALQVLTKVSRWHDVDLPPEAEMKALVQEQATKAQKDSEHLSIWLRLKTVISEVLVLLRTPRLRKRTLCIYLDFLMAGTVYFGLSLSGAIISDNPFLYMVLSALMEVPAYTLTIPLVRRLGSKGPLSSFFLTSGVVLLALAFTPSAYATTILTLAMLGKVAITGGFQTIAFFASELFPTEVRSRGISTSYMMSRIGAMVSPFITDLVGTIYPWAPFVVFGTGALLAGLGTLMLPETRGQTLPETVAQLEERQTRR
ncbi:organic cation transporter protein-like [Portunus trituberculatus]|uniref:organic cation transporter protein-like n=1 Tax=Portunus trituberculatus TaxID=210409 RepID=UPI001E1CF837|nr:organic cation transporter protein-like [Portunus trituberculatus]